MYPRQSPTTHTEQLGEEASVYDGRVRRCTPSTRPRRACGGTVTVPRVPTRSRRPCAWRWVPEADAVVDLTLAQLARLHLLELPVESRGDRPATTRRWLLRRGVAAAMLPAISSIVAPSPVEAQSPGSAAPTLTSLSPTQGARGTTVAVTLTGTNFVVGATTVNVSGSGVTVTNVTVSGRTPQTARVSRRTSPTAAAISGTSLTANFVIDPAAAEGPRTVTVTTAAGRARANLHDHGADAGGSDADQRRAESGRPGHHGGGHPDGHQFRRRRHDGERERRRRHGHQRRGGQQDVADRQLRARSGRGCGARTVTVTTAGGTAARKPSRSRCRRRALRR